jgi:hypothetical protein
MDGLFSLANKLFGINVEPADGLAPVSSIHSILLTQVKCSANVTSDYLFRFGIAMSNFIVSRILPIVLLLTFTSIHIQDHLKNVVGLG